MKLKIQRLAFLEDGTPGVIFLNDRPFCVCIERPWKNNIPNESCIPSGLYVVKWVMTNTAGNKKGRGLGVEPVKDRTLIRIHAGNTMNDLLGCIAPGLYFHEFSGIPGVSASTATLSKLMDRLEGFNGIPLLINNPH
jgi:hypothetical protein